MLVRFQTQHELRSGGELWIVHCYVECRYKHAWASVSVDGLVKMTDVNLPYGQVFSPDRCKRYLLNYLNGWCRLSRVTRDIRIGREDTARAILSGEASML